MLSKFLLFVCTSGIMIGVSRGMRMMRMSSVTGKRGFKVAVAGAAGGIGQPLALLLKLDANVKELSLFDVVRTPGVAADISHCCSPAQVKGYVGMEQAHEALEGCDVVVIPAGKWLICLISLFKWL